MTGTSETIAKEIGRTMRIKVTRRQFQLLLDNMDILTSNGLAMEMNGKTAKRIFRDPIPPPTASKK